MKRDGPKNFVTSVQARLVERSRELGVEHQLRGTEIPGERPLALTSEFADDAQKKIQWHAFVRRARRPELAELSAIIATLERFLWPVLQAAARGEPWPRTWPNGGPWKEL